MRINRGLGLAPGEFSAAVQQRLDREFPEKQYFGWARFSGYATPMTGRQSTGGLFAREGSGWGPTYRYFVATFGRPPLAVFNDPDFDIDPVAAGVEPAFSRITAKLAAIDRDLANYHGPIKNMSAGPAVDFSPSSPAYSGVDGSTIVFNTPGGPTTVVNGVPVSGPGITPPTSDKSGGSQAMMWGLGFTAVAGLLLLIFRK